MTAVMPKKKKKKKVCGSFPVFNNTEGNGIRLVLIQIEKCCLQQSLLQGLHPPFFIKPSSFHSFRELIHWNRFFYIKLLLFSNVL